MVWQNNKFPGPETVITTWHTFVLESKSLIERELSFLSINQRKILFFLATEEKTKSLFRKQTTEDMDLTASSAQRAITPLVEKDYVYIDQDGFYTLLDPLIKAIIR